MVSELWVVFYLPCRLHTVAALFGTSEKALGLLELHTLRSWFLILFRVEFQEYRLYKLKLLSLYLERDGIAAIYFAVSRHVDMNSSF